MKTISQNRGTVACLAACVCSFGFDLVADDDRGKRLLDAMSRLARQTEISRKETAAGGSIKLVPLPVFRYSDQPRRIVDATLWLWTDGGRPLAMQKIEAMYRNRSLDKPAWTFCFTSFSGDLLKVGWPSGRTYQCQQPGIKYEPLPGPPEAARSERLLQRQLRQTARRFTAKIVIDPARNIVEQMRLLPRPIYEYADKDPGLLAGAVFGLTTNGTNPDAYLVLEVVRGESEDVQWRYGLARMTDGGLQVRLDGKEVWSIPHIQVDPRPTPFDSWTYFAVPREIE